MCVCVCVCVCVWVRLDRVPAINRYVFPKTSREEEREFRQHTHTHTRFIGQCAKVFNMTCAGDGDETGRGGDREGKTGRQY